MKVDCVVDNKNPLARLVLVGAPSKGKVLVVNLSGDRGIHDSDKQVGTVQTGFIEFGPATEADAHAFLVAFSKSNS